jgi:hypothetical protein
MKTEKFSGTIESAYGKTLPEKLKFAGTYEAFTLPDSKSDEVVSIAFPDGADPITDTVTYGMIYDAVNNKRKAKARQKSMNDTLSEAGIEKPTMEDPQVQLLTIYKALRAAGRSEDKARELAETTLGVTFTTEPRG